MSHGRTYRDKNGESFRAFETPTGWQLVYANRVVFVGLV